jgi:hypothetical protein
MSTFCLNGFRRRDVFVQRARDEVAILIDADTAADAIVIAKKLLNGTVALFDGVEVESAPDEIKRRVMLLAQIETCTTTKPETEFLIR